MKKNELIEDLLTFLEATPTSYHTTDYIHQTLLKSPQPFTELSLQQSWDLTPGKHYLIKHGGTLIAFALPPKNLIGEAAFRIWATHSDSPALKLKSLNLLKKESALIALTEPYGGVLTPSWFNRDLFLAGRIFVGDSSKKSNPAQSKLISLKNLSFTIPAPAIHFKTRNEKQSPPNPEIELRALMGLDYGIEKKGTSPKNLEALLLDSLKSLPKQSSPPKQSLLGWDLMFVSAEAPKLSGLHEEFILASQLDNSAMTHIGFKAIESITQTSTSAKNSAKTFAKPFHHIPLLAVFNHEEIGSKTSEGADSALFAQILERISSALELNRQDFLKQLTQSFIISADMAHATHPNYPQLHSDLSRPLLGKGPVLKKNGHLRYISEGNGEAFIRQLASIANVPLQTLTARSDLGTGSTIGPLLASNLAIPSIDLGNPMLSMHSIRELSATADHATMLNLAQTFLSSPLPIPTV